MQNKQHVVPNQGITLIFNLVFIVGENESDNRMNADERNGSYWSEKFSLADFVLCAKNIMFVY